MTSSPANATDETAAFAHDTPPSTGQWKTGFFRRAWAIIRLRCPRCLETPVFHGRFAMHDKCAVCGHVLRREGGYFLGAMYFSYPIAVVLIGLFCLLQHLIFPGWSATRVFFGAWIMIVPFVPAMFRYSRVLWMHLDVAVEDLVRGTLC